MWTLRALGGGARLPDHCVRAEPRPPRAGKRGGRPARLGTFLLSAPAAAQSEPKLQALQGLVDAGHSQ